MKIAALTLISLLVTVQSPSPSQQDTRLQRDTRLIPTIETGIRAEFEHMKEFVSPKMASARRRTKSARWSSFSSHTTTRRMLTTAVARPPVLARMLTSLSLNLCGALKTTKLNSQSS